MAKHALGVNNGNDEPVLMITVCKTDETNIDLDIQQAVS